MDWILGVIALAAVLYVSHKLAQFMDLMEKDRTRRELDEIGFPPPGPGEA